MSPSDDRPDSQQDTIGLIAGNGKFPFLVLAEACRLGIPVVTIAIEGEAEAEIATVAERVHWVGLDQVSRSVELLKRAGVRRALMAGQVKHKQIFRVLRPDRLLLRVLSRLETRNPDAILGAVADVLAEEGIELMDSTSFLRPLITSPGTLGRRRPSREEQKDIAFGFRIARELARLDIGQTVVVKAKAVVAVEAMEGTDETIRRAGRVVSSPPGSPGGLTVVKVARPSQDMRFDVPVVGPRTVRVMIDAGASVLALEAGKSLLLEQDALLRRADEAGIALVGVTGRDREDGGA
ncbi:MAG: LpxI family protein [Acidobacteriota bacterium]